MSPDLDQVKMSQNIKKSRTGGPGYQAVVLFIQFVDILVSKTISIVWMIKSPFTNYNE